MIRRFLQYLSNKLNEVELGGQVYVMEPKEGTLYLRPKENKRPSPTDESCP